MMPVELDVAQSLEAKEPLKAAEYYNQILESVKGNSIDILPGF